MVTLDKPVRYENHIKKSRFIATAVRVDSSREARIKIEKIKDAAATHNCWAYKIGAQYRFSDDGEPGGTAGRPIFSAIEGQDLDHVLVVVTRYFGGIKLGAGGLTRAYLQTAAHCLQMSKKIEIKPKVNIIIQFGFDTLGGIHHVLERFKAEKQSERYGDSGVDFEVQIEEECFEHFRIELENTTRGGVKIITAPAERIRPKNNQD